MTITLTPCPRCDSVNNSDDVCECYRCGTLYDTSTGTITERRDTMDLLSERLQAVLRDYRSGAILATHVARVVDAMCADRTGRSVLPTKPLPWEAISDLVDPIEVRRLYP